MKHKPKQRHTGALKPGEGAGTVTLKLEYVVPENLISHFSDNFFVSYTGHEFILSFYQTQHPADMRPDALTKVRNMKAPCVSRVIITPNQMDRIIDVLLVNWNRWIETQGKQDSVKATESTEVNGPTTEQTESE